MAMIPTARGLALALALALVVPASPSLAAPPYGGRAILPSVGDRDAALRDFYEGWKDLSVVRSCGEGRCLVEVDADGKRVGGGTQAGTITVSEARGYAILLTVMMAEADPDARAVFDGMVRYVHDHPAASGTPSSCSAWWP